MASFLRTGPSEQQSTANFHPADRHDDLGPERKSQLGTFRTSWHMIDHDIGLKVGKIMLEKSLLPVGLENTKPC